MTCGRPLMLCSEPHMAYLVGPCGHLGCIHPVKAVLVVLVHNGKVWSPMDSLKHRGPSRARPWPTLEPNPWLQTIAKIDGCETIITLPQKIASHATAYTLRLSIKRMRRIIEFE